MIVQVKPLIWIESAVEKHSHSRVEYMIKAKSQFKRRSTANSVDVIIPVPSDADSGRFKATAGSVKYVPEKNAMVWSIKAFPVRLFFFSFTTLLSRSLGWKRIFNACSFQITKC